jgi:hypothetical protein
MVSEKGTSDAFIENFREDPFIMGFELNIPNFDFPTGLRAGDDDKALGFEGEACVPNDGVDSFTFAGVGNLFAGVPNKAEVGAESLDFSSRSAPSIALFFPIDRRGLLGFSAKRGEMGHKRSSRMSSSSSMGCSLLGLLAFCGDRWESAGIAPANTPVEGC